MMFAKINNMLESYNERDKILRLLCYTSQLVAGLTDNKKLSNLSGILSDCRTTLRLLDDLPMLNYSLSYGLGKKEPDMYMQVCGVVVNLLDQLYYPCEHIAWAADKGLLSLRSDPWWMASNVCWAFSLYFSMARSLRYMSMLHDHTKHLNLRDANLKEEYRKNLRLLLMELLSGMRYACDLVQAVHWLPDGFLWSGRLKQWQIGALGTVSSLISIYHTCAIKDIS